MGAQRSGDKPTRTVIHSYALQRCDGSQVRLLLSAIGYTFALIFSTQGAIQSTADLRKATAAIRRWPLLLVCCNKIK